VELLDAGVGFDTPKRTPASEDNEMTLSERGRRTFKSNCCLEGVAEIRASRFSQRFVVFANVRYLHMDRRS
jgi:hypothetical protein